jgi:hypothetical protein
MVEFFPLTEVGGVGDDFSVILFGQPLEDDGGVKPAGIGEDDLLYAAFFLP